MPDHLQNKKCVPCEGGIAPLTRAEIDHLLPQIHKWRVVNKTDKDQTIATLTRTLTFPDFRAAMAFLNDVAEIAESEGHHPDFCVHYNRVEFTLWTHAIGGLHENDFILAAKIDALFGDR